MSSAAVSNSACLIALERIGRADILAQSFASVFVPAAVRDELGYSPDWLAIRRVENVALLRSLSTQIGDGESEAIALAMELDGALLVLDDKKARRIAHAMGLEVIGTVGLVLRAKKRGIVAEVKPILDALNAVDFRIAPALYNEALRLANENK